VLALVIWLVAVVAVDRMLDLGEMAASVVAVLEVLMGA
jgi:hypothetical protein